jgi:hypothetical protein
MQYGGKRIKIMSTSRLRVAVRFAVLFTLVFALSLTQGWATPITNQGSSTIARTNLDIASGEVFIYNGGLFPSGETVDTFNWFGSLFTGANRSFTPLLFSVTGGVFTVAGIGNPQTIENGTSAGVNSVGFGLIAGTDVTGGNWTFGFVEGVASSSGSLSGASAGIIEHNNTVDGGTGVGGVGPPLTTNDWVFTPGGTNITTVAVNTTFGASGSNATFTLNNPGSGGTFVDRTYSANADQTLSGVAEPGTFSLITGAGLVLAGLFRYRYSRGRG